MKDDLPILGFASAVNWEAWLEENHDTSNGLWLKIAKKGIRTDSVSYAEAVDVALCFGWIDGQKAAHDAEFWLQRFTPRRVLSVWSRRNRERAAALLAEGRLRPAGLAAVERARQDGSWERAYDPQGNAAVPPDLHRELDRHPRARQFFETLNGVNRYAILYRVQTAKRKDTRARRIAKFVAMLEEGKTIH